MKLIETNYFTDESGQIIDKKELVDFKINFISSRCYFLPELNLKIYKLKQIYYDEETDFCNKNTLGGFLVNVFNNKIINSYISNGVVLFDNNTIENSIIIKKNSLIKNSSICDSQLVGEINIHNSKINNSILHGNFYINQKHIQDKQIFFKDNIELKLKYFLTFDKKFNLWKIIYLDKNILDGGYIDDSSYLSHENSCGIYDISKCINNSLIEDSAILKGNSVLDTSQIHDTVVVKDNSYIKKSNLFLSVNVSNSKVLETTELYGYFKDCKLKNRIKI